MKCEKCKCQMTQLFLTVACDHCDYGVPKEKLHKGYVVYQNNREEYVFRSRIDAERWRVASGREMHSIIEVFSLTPFRWHLSRGTLRDVVLADQMYEIFPDHRYEDAPYRAFLGQAVDSTKTT